MAFIAPTKIRRLGSEQLTIDVAAVTAAKADVRAGTQIIGAEVGTCAVPTAAQTVLDVPVDATVGTVTLPVEVTVKKGVTYGPGLSLTGTKPVTYRISYAPSSVISSPVVLDSLELIGVQAGGFPSVSFVSPLTVGELVFSGAPAGEFVQCDTPPVTILRILGLGNASVGLLGLGNIGLTHIEPPQAIYYGCLLTGNALPQEDIDGLLAACVMGEYEYGSLDLSGGTNAAPSPAGWTNYDILVARNWEPVSVNGIHP